MATLENIRSKAGILISIVIGLSLLAFILSDFFSSGKTAFSSSDNDIAKVDGKSISVIEYQQKVDKIVEIYKINTQKSSLDEQTTDQIREQSWNEIIRDLVMSKSYNDLAVTVSSQELFDMVQGNNPSPMIKQLFTNQETGVFSKEAVLRYLKNKDQDQTGNSNAFWLYIEGQLVRERLVAKYNALVNKGLYVTTLQAKSDSILGSKKVNINFISKLYSEIVDSTLKISNSDLKSYYKEHEKEYDQVASRDIEYVEYDVRPSVEDYTLAEQWVQNIKTEFENSKEEISQFVNLNSDVKFDEQFKKPSEFSDTIKNFIAKAKDNEVLGPYFEKESYKLVKIAKDKMLPDSVKARHILIKPTAQTKEAVDAAKLKADSLKKMIDKGVDFAELAKVNSEDKGSAVKGGDLGWFTEGKMVKPFNDASFNGKKGDIVIVMSDFGYHIINIQELGKTIKKYQIAILERKVEPSQVTDQNIYQKASSFAGVNNTAEKFDAAVKTQSIVKKVAANIGENDKTLYGLDSPRELIKWVYANEEKSISPVLRLGDKYIVAKLNVVRNDGIAPFEQVKDQIEVNVKKDKKAERIIESLKKDMAGLKTIEEVAGKINAPTLSASDINFNNSSIPNLGFEPNVIAAATVLDPYKVSAPIKGANGVYIISVTYVSPVTEGSVQYSKMKLANNYYSKAYSLYDVLKKAAEVKDNRSKFF